MVMSSLERQRLVFQSRKGECLEFDQCCFTKVRNLSISLRHKDSLKKYLDLCTLCLNSTLNIKCHLVQYYAKACEWV